MRRIVETLWVLVAVLPAAAFGQAASSSMYEEGKSIPVVLYPSAEPQPALRYQLLPPFLERTPGNAAVLWNQLPAERSGFFSRLYEKGGPWEKIEKWMDIPLDDPREKAYRQKELAKDIHILYPDAGFRTMERAARMESCNWEQPVRAGNFIGMYIPEIQQSRTYARLLAAKAHLEIAEGKYDQAIRTLQVGYAEARQVAQSPTIVSCFVGLTIAGIMSNQVQQFIEQPDTPNLYWALSTLPRPLVDFRPGAEAESNLLYLQFPELRDLDKKKLSPDEWRGLFTRIVDESSSIMKMETGTSPEQYQASIMLLAISGYPSAKRYLVEHGRTAAEVEAMPVAQVVLLYTVKLYDELGDNQFKWFYLPFMEADAGLHRADRELRKSLAAQREIIPFAAVLLPASLAAKQAETRLDWIVAGLRIMEAMRLYAANHHGCWPDRLGDITEVPIPVNPYDGKPFVYQRHGDQALLTVEHGPRGFHWGYEITLKQKRS
jgi:hypothetical protein